MATIIERPEYHFSAKNGWINDPNGLIFFQGKYHLFYQYNPYSTSWSMMHWGHAISDDLVHWEDLPIALFPDQWYEKDINGGCFSGSAIEQDGTLFLIYTSVVDGIQRQSIAYSKDGIAYSKFEGNPIIEKPSEYKDFRDPKVFRYEGFFYIVVGASDGNSRNDILLYRSSNLYEWENLGVLFSIPEEVGYMPECPDFFPFDDKWVLTFSPMNYKDAGACVVAVIGSMDFDRISFSVDSIQPVDSGADYYASQSFLSKDNERYSLAWAGEWPWMSFFKDHGPTESEGWRGFMNNPRQLQLKDGHLYSYPVSGIDKIFSTPVLNKKGLSFEKSAILVDKLPAVSKISFSFKNFIDSKICIEFGSRSLLMDFASEKVVLTEQKEKYEFSAPMHCDNNEVELDIYLDHSSFEVFIEKGYSSISKNWYARNSDSGLSLNVLSGTLDYSFTFSS